MKKLIGVLLSSFLLVSCGEPINSTISSSESSTNSSIETSKSEIDSEISSSISDSSEASSSSEVSSSSMEEEVVSKKRVIIIGVDGAGNNFTSEHTPKTNKIMSGDNCANTYDCLTSNPTISAQCWGSMLSGVTPSVHGFTNDVLNSSKNTTHPTVFKQAYEQIENPILASFVNWNAINIGLVEDDIGVYKYNYADDNYLADKICKYLSTNDPDLLYVQFDSVDHAGHAYGYNSKLYYDALANIDDLIAQIYTTLDVYEMLEDTTFIVTADHGGINYSHGGLSSQEKYIYVGIKGKNINKTIIKDMQVRDMASIIAYALGINKNECWDSYIPLDLFKDNMNPEQREKQQIDDKPGDPTPDVNDPNKGLYKYINSNDINKAYFFDDSFDDINGSVAKEKGKVYFVNSSKYGKSLNLNGDGYLSLEDFSLSNSKNVTIGAYINLLSEVSNDPVLFSNKDWNLGKNSGLTVAFLPNSIKLSIGYMGNIKDERFYSYPNNYVGNWFHFMLSFNMEKREISCYINFKLIDTFTLSNSNLTIESTYPFNIGQDGTGTYPYTADFLIDDLMILDKAISKEEIETFMGYYGIKKEEKESIITPDKDASDGLYSFINKDDLLLGSFFDENTNDLKGGSIVKKGNPIYEDDAIFGKSVRINDSFYLDLKDIKLSDQKNYTIAAYINMQSSLKVGYDPILFANKDWMSGTNSGLAVAFRPDNMKLSIGYNGSIKQEEFYNYPSDYLTNWFHFMLVIDMENRQIKAYINFSLVATTNLNNTNLTIESPYSLKVGQDGKGSYDLKPNFLLDDLLVFNKALIDSEIDSLKQYYNR